MRIFFICLINHNTIYISTSVCERREQESAFRKPCLIIIKEWAENTYNEFIYIFRFPQIFFVFCLYGNIITSKQYSDSIRLFWYVFFSDKFIKISSNASFFNPQSFNPWASARCVRLSYLLRNRYSILSFYSFLKMVQSLQDWDWPQCLFVTVSGNAC